MARYTQLHKLRNALIIASVALTGCAANQSVSHVDVEATTDPAKTPAASYLTTAPDMPIQDWFKEARSMVGDALKTDLSGVDLQVTDTSGIAVHARTSLLHALGHDLDNPRFAENLVNNILTMQTESVLAIYAPSIKQILLHNENLSRYLQATPTPPKQALQALLIHELVHASDDQKYNAFQQNSLSYQEVFAKSAVVEGHAQWQTRKICKKYGCDGAFNALNSYMFNSGSPDDPALQYVQSRSFKNLEFVYKEGERFIDQLRKRRNGKAALALAFSNPPRDSIQIIDPDSFPNRKREKRNDALSQAIDRTEKPWNTHSTGSLKRNILAAAAFTVDPAARNPVVSFYTSKIIAATKHEYYEHTSDTPIPVAVIALQTDSPATARKTATLIYNSTLNTYNQLRGDLVKITAWDKDNHSADIDNQYIGNKKIEMQTASSYVENGLVNAEYPVEVVTATSGPFLVHIDGRYANGEQDLMQFAGRLLLSLQHNHRGR